ncbi:MAG: FAD-binding oxidoreductase [Rhodospirillaceae bacterium]
MNTEKVVSRLGFLVGPDHVLTDDVSLSHFSEDLFFEGQTPLAVVAPGLVSETCKVVKLCTNEGIALLPRGGGLSYTAGYVQTQDNPLAAILVDTRRLNRVIDLSPENMTVTAEAGCTWEQVMEATSAQGLRPTMFGPSTGRFSTLGGSLSNNCMFFGSANNGTAADAVVGLDIVAADGALVRTGSGAIKNGTPFYRNNGPDLTGLFLADGGALGIKAAATLRLEKIPEGRSYASFSFASFETLIPIVQEIGRSGLASECLGLGPAPLDHQENGAPAIHIVCEGWTQGIADEKIKVIERIVGDSGTPLNPAMPTYIRENAYSFVQSSLDAAGRLQIWTHGIFPIGDTLKAYTGFMDVMKAHAAEMQSLEIEATLSFACAGTAMMVEPVLRWQGSASHLHRTGMGKVEESAESTAEMKNREAHVRLIREDFKTTMDSLGAAHMQYGRFYDYASMTDENTVNFLRSLKRGLDPKGLMNPGVLGL